MHVGKRFFFQFNNLTFMPNTAECLFNVYKSKTSLFCPLWIGVGTTRRKNPLGSMLYATVPLLLQLTWLCCWAISPNSFRFLPHTPDYPRSQVFPIIDISTLSTTSVENLPISFPPFFQSTTDLTAQAFSRCALPYQCTLQRSSAFVFHL